jgi:hypothetical protein
MRVSPIEIGDVWNIEFRLTRGAALRISIRKDWAGHQGWPVCVAFGERCIRQLSMHLGPVRPLDSPVLAHLVTPGTWDVITSLFETRRVRVERRRQFHVEFRKRFVQIFLDFQLFGEILVQSLKVFLQDHAIRYVPFLDSCPKVLWSLIRMGPCSDSNRV